MELMKIHPGWFSKCKEKLLPVWVCPRYDTALPLMIILNFMSLLNHWLQQWQSFVLMSPTRKHMEFGFHFPITLHGNVSLLLRFHLAPRERGRLGDEMPISRFVKSSTAALFYLLITARPTKDSGGHLCGQVNWPFQNLLSGYRTCCFLSGVTKERLLHFPHAHGKVTWRFLTSGDFCQAHLATKFQLHFILWER